MTEQAGSTLKGQPTFGCYLRNMGPGASASGLSWAAGFLGMLDVEARQVCTQTGPHLLSCSVVTAIKFLIVFEQGWLHFHFVLDSPDDIESPVFKRYFASTLFCDTFPFLNIVNEFKF